MRGSWQNFNWHDASRGPSAIAELLVFYSVIHVTRWHLWHSDFTKFNFRCSSFRRPPDSPSRLGSGSLENVSVCMSQVGVLLKWFLFPTPLGAFGLYRWAMFGWNLYCYACSVLSLLRNTHIAPHNRHMKAWRHPQNRKYITYRNAPRGEPNHGHMQHAQKFGEVRPCGFRVMQADRQTNRQVNRHTHHNTSHPYGSRCTMCIPEQQWNTVISCTGLQHMEGLWKDLGYMFQSVLKLLRYKFVIQFAGERIDEHLAKLQNGWLYRLRLLSSKMQNSPDKWK